MCYLMLDVPSEVFLPLRKQYLFNYQGHQVSIEIYNNKWVLTVIDQDNELIWEDKRPKLKKPIVDFTKDAIMITNDGEPTLVYDMVGNASREFFATPNTRVVMKYETERTAIDEQFCLDTIDYFFKAYQAISGDIYALSNNELIMYSMVPFKYFYEYSEIELAMCEIDRFKLIVEKEFSPIKFHLNAVRIKNRFKPEYNVINDTSLSTFLSAAAGANFVTELIAKAARHISAFKNYKYGLLECFFAIESIIYQYVTMKKTEKGISIKKIKESTGRVGISYIINIEMPLLLNNYDLEAKSLLNEIDKIRKVRNEVVHQGAEVTKVQAEHALEFVKKLCAYLGLKRING